MSARPIVVAVALVAVAGVALAALAVIGRDDAPVVTDGAPGPRTAPAGPDAAAGAPDGARPGAGRAGPRLHPVPEAERPSDAGGGPALRRRSRGWLARPARRGLLDRRIAVVRMSCRARGTTWCRGRLTLHAGATGVRARRARPVGARRFELAPRTRTLLRVPVAARRLPPTGRVVVRAVVADGGRRVAHRVVLRRW